MFFVRYYVVDFLVSPHPDTNKYACVPESWLKWCDEECTVADVAYPNENPVAVIELARNNESDTTQWRTYKAFVIYRTYMIDDAINYIEMRREPSLPRFILSPPISEEDPELSQPLPPITVLEDGSFLVNNKVYKRRTAADLDKRALIALIRTEMMMKSAATVSLLSGAKKRSTVHDDLLNEYLRSSSTVNADSPKKPKLSS